MYDYELKRDVCPPRILVRNCDKEGAFVAARVASAIGGVSTGRSASIRVDRFPDRLYFADMAARLVKIYGVVGTNRLMDRRTVVLAAPHPCALYIAEVLHAILLPLQILSFPRDLEEAATTGMLGILGADYDVRGYWLLNKITSQEDVPSAYLNILRAADHAVVVRSTDTGWDCPLIGRFENIYVNATLERLYPDLLDAIRGRLALAENGLPELRQWEWGLPDATVTAVSKVWRSLGKSESAFHLIESSVLSLYAAIPRIWRKYFEHNGITPRGLTLNGYGVAHPVYERAAGLIPVHFYRFGLMRDVARSWLRYFSDTASGDKDICVFANYVGGADDVSEILQTLADLDLQKRCWFSNGLDAPDTACVNAFGLSIPGPAEKVAEWLPSAEYSTREWTPLPVENVESLVG